MLLIFDFDGTIADSLGVYIKVINYYFKTSITKHNVRTKGTVKLIKESGIPILLLPLYILKARHEAGKHIGKMQLIHGIKDILYKLKNDHKLAIVTSNSKGNVLKFLEKEGMVSYFNDISDSLTFQGKHKKITRLMRKLNYKEYNTVYIGDETRDIMAAKKAGVKSIAVSWGYESRKLLIKAKPDFLITKQEHLLKSIRSVAE